MTLAVGVDSVKATALDKNVSQQYLLQPTLGLFEMRAKMQPEPLPALALLVEPDIDMSRVEPSLVKRLFRALASAVEPAQAFADTPPTIGTTKGKGMMAQAADPNFELWQKNADERLKQEEKIRQAPPHRLALQHPDQYVVVCEAGCRKDTEEIVYAVAKREALAAVTRLEPTSAEASNAAPQPATEGRIQEADTILCIAGCYDSPKVHAARQKSASLEKPAGNSAVTSAAQRKTAAHEPEGHVTARHETASHGTASRDTARHVIARHETAGGGKIAHAAPSTNATAWRTEVKAAPAPILRMATIRPWQTRTIYETPSRIAATALPKLRAPGQRAGTGVASAGKGQWRTKIIFATATRPAGAPSRTSRLERVKRLRRALQPMHEARHVQYAVSETRY